MNPQLDPLFDPMQEPEDREDQKAPSCNRCGSRAVRWRQQGGAWVLFSLQAGVEHACDFSNDFDEATS